MAILSTQALVALSLAAEWKIEINSGGDVLHLENGRCSTFIRGHGETGAHEERSPEEILASAGEVEIETRSGKEVRLLDQSVLETLCDIAGGVLEVVRKAYPHGEILPTP